MNQKNIYIEAYGCALNIADYETIMNELHEHGYTIVDSPNNTKKIMIHTCTVKAPTIERMYSRIKKYKDQGKEVIISGCLAKTDRAKLSDYILVPPDKIFNLIKLIEKPSSKKKNQSNKNIKNNSSNKNNNNKKNKKLRKNKTIEIIAVCQGCVGKCTYCKVKLARGKLISRPIKEIKKQLQNAIKEGIKEIWITAQDMGCYGYDINTNIIELLKELILVKGDFKLRLGMINPNFAYYYLKDLKKIFQSEKMYQFIHIPLQSGSNNVLKSMKREYKKRHFKVIVKHLRKQNPNFTIATDIITGFPGETEKDFRQTLNILSQTKPEVVNISRFWSLKETAAHKLNNHIPQKIIKKRTKELTNLFYKIAEKENKKWLDWSGEIYLDEKAKNSINGRNFAYRPVLLPIKNNSNSKKKLKIGDSIKVKITNTTIFDLQGKIE